MRSENVSALILLILVSLLLSCQNEGEIRRQNIVINNSSFNGRVNYEVDSMVSFGGSTSGRSKASVPAFKLRAEVFPPVYNGITLRASHIYVDNDYAYVVYNLEGEAYLGGVEVFNIKDIKRPFIESQAIFVNTDVSSVYYDNNAVYLAQATGDQSLGSPAVMEELQIEGGKLTTKSRKTGLKSYAATDICVSANMILVTSGSTGGLFFLDKNTLKQTAFINLDDARAVAFDQSNSVITMQGSPARISIFDTNGQLQKSFSFVGANIPGSKSMFALKNNAILIAAGDGGTYSIDKRTGVVNFNIPIPKVEGLDPSLAVCNSVAAWGDMLYMANGEAGLYGAKIQDESQKYGDLSPIRFSSKTSINHVAAKGKAIFLAAGTGGLKIVEVEQ